MTSNQIGIIIAITVYLFMMLIIGAVFSKKNNSVGDFYLGGRKLGPLVTAMSAEASDMSSWLLMGLPGLAYLSGVADAGWTAIGLAVGTYINWLLVAKRLRNYTQVAGNSITIPDFFKNRFRDNSNALLLIGALFIIIFFIPYTASGFAACGKLFSSLFGVNYEIAMIVSAVIIVGYTTTGGFLAASFTDFIQSIIMTIALIIVLTYGISTAGGWNAVMDNAQSLAGFFSLNQTYNNATDAAQTYPVLNMVTMMAWGLGYFGMPHILLRFMAIDDSKKLKLSRRVASIWVVISLTIGVFIGIVGRAMTSAGALENLVDMSNPTSSATAETIIVKIADLISRHGFGFALVAGLILAGILASTMSTADSQLLAASSAVSHNIIEDVLHINLSEKKSMLVARITLVVVAIAGVIIAYNPNSSVFNIVSFAWAGFGAVFGPVILFALFWKRTNRWGALAGMITGGAMVFIWKYAVRPLGGAWDVYELLPAFIVAALFIVIVSLATPAPSAEITEEFEKVKAMN